MAKKKKARPKRPNKAKKTGGTRNKTPRVTAGASRE
jgi:hypothetical protein